MNLVIDIETIANPDMINILPEVKAKSNLVKPEAIAKDIAEKKQKQIDKMGLSPYFGKIVCIGSKENNDEGFVFEDEEVEMLKKLQADMTTRPRIITFNGFQFDIPFLNFRYLFHGLKSPFTYEYLKRYDNSAHYDILMELTSWRGFTDQNSIDMNTLGKVFGFDIEEGFSGADVQKAFDSGEIEKIVNHCKLDIELTSQIFGKITGNI